MHWLSIENICCTLFGYPLSYVELAGTATGLASVWLAARINIWTWPIGIINALTFFVLFYQVQLYSDMVLQLYFLATTIYGWYYWSRRDATDNLGKIIRRLATRTRLYLAVAVVLATVALGTVTAQVHEWWPSPFPEPAAYPYPNAFTTTLSVTAMLLMARRRLECWALWCTVNVVSVVLYLVKGILLTALLYLAFLGISLYGWFDWQRKRQHESRS